MVLRIAGEKTDNDIRVKNRSGNLTNELLKAINDYCFWDYTHNQVRNCRFISGTICSAPFVQFCTNLEKHHKTQREKIGKMCTPSPLYNFPFFKYGLSYTYICSHIYYGLVPTTFRRCVRTSWILKCTYTKMHTVHCMHTHTHNASFSIQV